MKRKEKIKKRKSPLEGRLAGVERSYRQRGPGKSFIPLHDDLEKTVQSQYLANEYTGQSGCGIIVAYLFSQMSQWEGSYECRN